VLPTLSVAETVAVLRTKYVAALVCTACAVLLATSPASYAKSNLTEAQRLEYVCAECRWEAAEAAQLKVTRAEIGRQNIAKAHAANRERRGTGGHIHGLPADPHQSVVFSRPNRDGRAYDPARDGGLGRPPVPAAEQKRKARERARAYRQRHVQAVTA
jgi:hypothetical protein